VPRASCPSLASALVWLAWLACLAPAQARAQPRDEAPTARVLLFTEEGCSQCERVRREVLPPLEARFGDRLVVVRWDLADPAHYEALMALEDAHEVPFSERAVPALAIGDRLLEGAERIERELASAIEASLAAGGNGWPEGLEVEAPREPVEAEDAREDTREDTAPARTGGAPIWLAYFHQTGCRECSRARRDLAWVRERHPRVRVEEHNVYDDAALGFWLAERAGRELETPAIFVGDDALIGAEEVEARALERLVRRYDATGAPRVWDDFRPSEGVSEAVARFRSLGPLAVIAAGLVDGINPCAFATLIFFVSYLRVSGRRGRAVLSAGAAFTLGVFLAYLLVGLGLYRVLDRLGGALTTAGRWVMIATAVVCAVLAALSVRDYFLARRGRLKDMSLNLPHALRTRIHAVIRRGKRARYFVAGAFATGLVVSILELACTGQVYLPTIIFVTSVPELRATALGYLVLYNLLFVLPLVVVFVAVYLGTSSQQLTDWLRRHAQAVKLGLAAFFALMALWLAAAAFPGAAVAQPSAGVAVGRPAPTLDVEWVVGRGPSDLEALRGRVVVVAFFSARCPACRDALDGLDELARTRRDAGVRVLGVSADHPRMLRGLFEERPVRFPVGRDAGGVFSRWSITHVPTFVVLDREGEVRAVLVGRDGLARLEDAVRLSL
jgi:cytochrome c biogenesis protein CcdA/peroxiredoxin